MTTCRKLATGGYAVTRGARTLGTVERTLATLWRGRWRPCIRWRARTELRTTIGLYMTRREAAAALRSAS